MRNVADLLEEAAEAMENLCITSADKEPWFPYAGHPFVRELEEAAAELRYHQSLPILHETPSDDETRLRVPSPAAQPPASS